MYIALHTQEESSTNTKTEDYMKAPAITVATDERPVMNVKETAHYLGVCESLVWKMIKERKLKPARLGDRVLFHKSYIDRVLCEGR
jgi:excisionase family DNA binding protein